MFKAIISDFSKTLLLTRDKEYKGSLNDLYREIQHKPDLFFWEYFDFNSSIYAQLVSLKKEHDIPLYVITNGKAVHHAPELEIFIEEVEEIYGGVQKTDPVEFEQIISKIGIEPEEIFYIDDNPKYIAAAEQVGLQCYQYPYPEPVDLKREVPGF